MVRSIAVVDNVGVGLVDFTCGDLRNFENVDLLSENQNNMLRKVVMGSGLGKKKR